MRKLLKLFGSIVLSLATMAFIAATSLFVVGTFLTTWPVLRLSPRDRRVRAAIDLATAGIQLAQTFQRSASLDELSDH